MYLFMYSCTYIFIYVYTHDNIIIYLLTYLLTYLYQRWGFDMTANTPGGVDKLLGLNCANSLDD